MDNLRGNSEARHGHGAGSPAGLTRRHALTMASGVLAGAALAQAAVPAFAASGASTDADAIVVGHGLAGLVATAELAAAGRKVLLLDQEPESNLGGQAFWSFGASTLPEHVAGMNKLTGDDLIDLADLKRQIDARDREIDNPYTKDVQVMGIRNALSYPGDSLSRTASAHRILDVGAGPLIAVRLNILTRKTLGGLQTDLSGRVLDSTGTPIPGLYAAGEVAGFGGGGVHGYRSLEGTFLGGCLFSGRQTGRAAAAATAS
jgi:predicted oxidoreductase